MEAKYTFKCTEILSHDNIILRAEKKWHTDYSGDQIKSYKSWSVQCKKKLSSARAINCKWPVSSRVK